MTANDILVWIAIGCCAIAFALGVGYVFAELIRKNLK